MRGMRNKLVFMIPFLDMFQEPKQKGRDFGGSLKRKGIESDEDSPPRKMPPHRRMAVVYDSDEEWKLASDKNLTSVYLLN
jgi:hypothetical protein